MTDDSHDPTKRKKRTPDHGRKRRGSSSRKKSRKKSRGKRPTPPLLFDTGLIPVLVAVTNKQQYEALQRPIPLQQSEINDFTDAVLPPGIIESSTSNTARMWIIAQLYSIEDYFSRDLGDQLANTIHLLMPDSDDLMSVLPLSNILVVYSSTGEMHNFPSPILKPYPPDLPQNSVYLAYMGIPFGVFGTERQITAVFDRLVDNHTDEVSERTQNFLQARLGVDTFPLLPLDDASLPDYLSDIEQDLQAQFPQEKRPSHRKKAKRYYAF